MTTSKYIPVKNYDKWAKGAIMHILDNFATDGAMRSAIISLFCDQDFRIYHNPEWDEILLCFRHEVICDALTSLTRKKILKSTRTKNSQGHRDISYCLVNPNKNIKRITIKKKEHLCP